MTLRIDGVEGVLADLEGMASRMRDLTPVMEVAAEATVSTSKESFDVQASPSGAEWAELSPVTEAMRFKRRGRGKGPGPQIRKLIDTGRLSNSISGESSKTGFRFGSNVVYAAAQHFGNPDNRMFGGVSAPIPARPLFPVVSVDGRLELMTGGRADEHWDYVRDVVETYIKTGEL